MIAAQPMYKDEWTKLMGKKGWMNELRTPTGLNKVGLDEFKKAALVIASDLSDGACDKCNMSFINSI